MPIDYFSIFGKSSTTGSSHVNLTMGGLVVAQGLYVCFVNKPKSKSALVIGLAVGGLYGISGYLINLNRAELGHALGCAVSVALSIRMGHYALKSGVFFPRGVMAVLATGSSLYNASKLLEIYF